MYEIFLPLDVPRLPPQEQQNDEDSQNQEDDSQKSKEEDTPKERKNRKTSGPKVEDPYQTEDGSMFYPMLIAVALFVPVVLLLCKL